MTKPQLRFNHAHMEQFDFTIVIFLCFFSCRKSYNKFCIQGRQAHEEIMYKDVVRTTLLLHQSMYISTQGIAALFQDFGIWCVI